MNMYKWTIFITWKSSNLLVIIFYYLKSYFLSPLNYNLTWLNNKNPCKRPVHDNTKATETSVCMLHVIIWNSYLCWFWNDIWHKFCSLFSDCPTEWCLLWVQKMRSCCMTHSSSLRLPTSVIYTTTNSAT